MQEIRGLTGMRGMAAFYVLVYHYNTFFAFNTWIPIISSGFSGVEFFFVLTGFLLAKLYGAEINWRRYFVRRVFRTWPLYYVCLPLFVLTGAAFTPLMFVYLQNYFPATFSFNPLWTLTIEECFYFAIFPIARLALGHKNRMRWLLIGSAVLSVGWRIFFPSQYAWTQMPDYLVCYAFGMWAAEGGFKDKGMALFFWLAVSLGLSEFNITPLFYGAAYALVLLAFQDSRAFTNRIVYYLGKISYGVYIYQLPLLLVFGIWGGPLTLLVAAVSFKYFESPLVAYGRRLTT